MTPKKRPDQYPKGTYTHVYRHGNQCHYCGIPVYESVIQIDEHTWGMYLGSQTVIQHTPPGTNWERATIDHVVPLAHGGTHTLDNFVLACLRCNSSKGTRPADQWRPR